MKFSELPEHKVFEGHIDEGMLSAVDNYFEYGLKPGSCTSKLIAGDYMDAWFSAHRLIQPHDIWHYYYELGEAIQRYKARIGETHE